MQTIDLTGAGKPAPEVIPPQEAADRIGMPLNSLKKLVSRRAVPHCRTGVRRGHLLGFTEEHIKAIVQQLTVTPRTTQPRRRSA